MTVRNAKVLLRDLFDAAVAAADPMRFIAANLPKRPSGRVLVIGAGKASARMAEAVEAEWGPCEGLVIVPDGCGRPLRGIAVREATHPVSDVRGLAATKELMALVASMGEGDLVLALISGGGSALLEQPAGNITLADLQALNRDLLASGMPIGGINIVRKHISKVKGGQLAALAYPSRVLSLMISDVPNDDPALIASGPTVGDNSTPRMAGELLEQFGIMPTQTIEDVLSQAAGSGVVPIDDVRLARVDNRVVAAPVQSLAAAAERAQALGMCVKILGHDIEGEAREVGRVQAEKALMIQMAMAANDAPIVLISGGECTVIRRGEGSGGPNAEFVLGALVALEGAPGISVLAGDTDGVDGSAEIAGAFADQTSLLRAQAHRLDPAIALAKNDAHSFFMILGDNIITGPTLTNVNDFRAILIMPKSPS